MAIQKKGTDHDDKQQSIKKTNGNAIQWQFQKCIGSLKP
jgi:hypothetical protein